MAPAGTQTRPRTYETATPWPAAFGSWSRTLRLGLSHRRALPPGSLSFVVID